jgi:anti-sigma regulatory factor (Ser/Thr protein kinase)
VIREDVRVHARTNPKFLSALRGLVRCYVNTFGIDTERTEDIVLAVDEACTNAIRHAYQGREDATLEVVLGCDGDLIEIRVEDTGSPASREELARTHLDTPTASDLRPGGLGVPLIRTIFDEVYFVPGAEHGNSVIMRTKVAGKADQQQAAP